MCQILDVSHSRFYLWLAAAPVRAERVRADAEIATRIRVMHADSDGIYGAPRITAELREVGIEVNYKRVERVIREHGIVGVYLCKSVRITAPIPTRTRCRT
ncbi:IS3 family transposase [Rhodococcus sp. B50]|uniref:IS3 family transposase n=1 Tax=Rhodococcus sp. B50 TaxID=2682847 RepID=UPI0035ABEB04